MSVCVNVCVFDLLASQRANQTKEEPRRGGGGDMAEDQMWWSRLSPWAQDLPGLCTLSQKAFSDLPTKFEARHQYFPASFSVTLDSFKLLLASVWLLTTLCEGRIESHSEAFTANSCTCTTNTHSYTQFVFPVSIQCIIFYIWALKHYNVKPWILQTHTGTAAAWW